jgi:hypothetical protein
MNDVLGTFSGGQIHLDALVNWPERVRVRVEPMNEAETLIVGMTEEEQSDAAKLDEWLAKFDAIEPLEFTPEEEASIAAFRAHMKQLSVEDVRRQMEAGE